MTSWGPLPGGAGGRPPPPPILEEKFSIHSPSPDFGGFCSEMFKLYNKVCRAERMRIDFRKNFKISLKFSKFLLKFS